VRALGLIAGREIVRPWQEVVSSGKKPAFVHGRVLHRPISSASFRGLDENRRCSVIVRSIRKLGVYARDEKILMCRSPWTISFPASQGRGDASRADGSDDRDNQGCGKEVDETG